MHIEISLATKFRLSTLEFLNQIKTQRVFPNQKKKKKGNYHQILLIQINLDSKFQFQQFWFLEQISKKYASGGNQKQMNIIIEFFIFKLV